MRLGVVHGDLNEYNILVRVKPEFLGDGSNITLNDDPPRETLRDDPEEAEEDDGEEDWQDGPPRGAVTGAEEHAAGGLPKLATMPRISRGSAFYLELVAIDFPQMIGVDDAQAEEQFDRDLRSYQNFLNRRFQAGLQLPLFSQVIGLVQPRGDRIHASEEYVRRQIASFDDQPEEEQAGLRPGRDVRECVRRQCQKEQRSRRPRCTKGAVGGKTDLTKQW